MMASAQTAMPQSWNRYTYVLNNPLRFVDPSGLEAQETREEILRRIRERQQNQPVETTQTPATEIQPRPVFGIAANSVSVFSGTFPSSGGNPLQFGERAVNPAGTSSVLPFGFNLSVNYTVTRNGVPIEGVEIFEEVQVEQNQVVRAPDGSFQVDTTQLPGFSGPVAARATDGNGNFTDAPLGTSNSTPITSASLTQTLYTTVNGQRRDLVVNSINANFNVNVQNNRVSGDGRANVRFNSPTLNRTLSLPGPRRFR
jgi:hypothetical protein